MARSDWSTLVHLGSFLLFSCTFSSKTPAHIFRLALVEFVRKISHTSVWPCIYYIFMQDLMVEIGP
jgi:hypothetical protein